MTPPEAVQARELSRMLADAVARVEQVSGTLGIGSVTHPVVPTQVTRFVEGRWSALREVDRRARLDGVAVALATVRRDWSTDPAPTTTDARAAAGTEAATGDAAYRQGGLAALDDLAAVLAT